MSVGVGGTFKLRTLGALSGRLAHLEERMGAILVCGPLDWSCVLTIELLRIILAYLLFITHFTLSYLVPSCNHFVLPDFNIFKWY